MPIHLGKDSKGAFVQWGNRTKYHYKSGDKNSLNRARAKAKKQMRAIFASGYIGESIFNKTYQKLLKEATKNI